MDPDLVGLLDNYSAVHTFWLLWGLIVVRMIDEEEKCATSLLSLLLLFKPWWTDRGQLMKIFTFQSQRSRVPCASTAAEQS